MQMNKITSVETCQVENLANRYGVSYKDALELYQTLKGVGK